MRSLLTVSFLAALSSMSAATIFQENFNGSPNTIEVDSTLGVIPGTLFSLTSGTIDVNGPAFYSQLCSSPASGYCIDTTGGSGSRGTITTTNAIEFAPGSYLLTFDLLGWNDQRGNTAVASIKVTLGSLIDQTYIRDGSAAAAPSVSIPFTVAAGSNLYLSFSDTGASDTKGYAGAVLDNIQITSTLNGTPVTSAPEPASFLMAGGALAALAAWRFRKQ